MTQKQEMQKPEHWPTLNTVMMVERTLEDMNESVISVAELKRKLPRQVNHNTLMLILEYLERSNKIAVGLRGISWLVNNNPNLKKAIEFSDNQLMGNTNIGEGEREEATKLLLRNIRKMPDFVKVRFVILFGSQASGLANNLSDYDFAIYYEGNAKERFKFRIRALAGLSDKFDVQVFQDLPLYVQKEILKGNLVYAQDERFVYDIAYQIIKSFNDIKGYYYDYINLEKIK
jgi:predicted nucleotidyltransferase